jgi:hypothetical protein
MILSELSDTRIGLIRPLHPGSDPVVVNTSDPGAHDNRWDRIVDELIRLRSFRNDWDGQGAAAPNDRNVDGAIDWVGRMRCYPQAIPPTQVVPGVAGEVFLVWQTLWQGQPCFLEAELSTPVQVEWMLAISGQPTKHWATPHDTFCFVGMIP